MTGEQPDHSAAPVLPERKMEKNINSINAGEIGILDTLIAVAPMIQQALFLDNVIVITDREKYIHILSGKEINLDTLIGKTLTEGEIMHRVVKQEEIVTAKVPKRYYGTPFKASGVPLRDGNNRVVGGFGIGISLVNQDILTEITNFFKNTSEKIAAKTHVLSNTAEQLTEEMETLSSLEKEVMSHVNKTNTILEFINEVAMKSKILGLNAAIEAARAGEHGKGFGVVAHEIRQMADTSNRSVKEIQDILVTTNKKVKQMAQEIQNVNAISQQQAAATEEISASMQEIASSVGKLEKASQIL